MSQGPNTYVTSTATHKEYLHHTSHPSYSVTSGFITKVLRVCEALVDVCGLSLRAFTGASSTGPLNFAMYPERAVGLIFIPFSASR
jgi:archaellum biogenesis ATPase FlaH